MKLLEEDGFIQDLYKVVMKTKTSDKEIFVDWKTDAVKPRLKFSFHQERTSQYIIGLTATKYVFIRHEKFPFSFVSLELQFRFTIYLRHLFWNIPSSCVSRVEKKD